MHRLDYEPRPAPHRVNLRVSFKDKDQVKALGAKWDSTLKTWYIAADMDMLKFRRWLP
ncbi:MULTISPECIES: DUF5710 domain-containing protein [Streptomyces]